MSNSIKRYIVLLNSTAEATGNWVQLDSRYNVDNTRAIQVYIQTAGDTVVIQGTTKDVKGIDSTFLTNLTAADISTLKIYAQTEDDILEGPWTYIRAIKTGILGNAKVSGMV